MPVYEYECEKCGSSFERIVFQGEKEELSCPECDPTNVKKAFEFRRFYKNRPL